MKSGFGLFLLGILIPVSFNACSDSEDPKADYVASFSYEMDAENTNLIHFKNTSAGDYLYVEWDYSNGELSGKSTDKTSVRSIHYPNKGTYTVTLTLWGNLNKESDTKSVSKTFSIENDDPEFASGTLLWSDEFDGSSINMNNWTFETGAGGWGNNELQNYTNGDNAHISDGKLIITARKVNNNQVAGSYTSTRMVTLGKQEFTYGRMEVRAKLPSGTGIWPAIWMLGSNINSVGWPACGELDIMEYVGYEPNTIHATVHTPAGHAGDGEGSSKTLNTAEEEFHIYGMIWDENAITFYTDSPENITHVYSPAIKTVNNWPFDQSQFFILNIAVGGNWGGAQGIDNNIFPQTMEVDYVRVYALDEN